MSKGIGDNVYVGLIVISEELKVNNDIAWTLSDYEDISFEVEDEHMPQVSELGM